MKRLYRDRAGGPEHTVVVAGVARSGTTWLAEVIGSQVPTRIMFEPFHNRNVAGYREFEYIQYQAPTAEDPRLHAFATRVMNGAIRDPAWIDRDMHCLRPELRVVKEVRACLLLGWLTARFPHSPILLVVRHPCAVVASFLRLGWSSDTDLASMLAQDALVQDHLQDVLPVIRAATRPHEKHTVMWCINHRVALAQPRGPRMARLYFEDLLGAPTRVIPRIFNLIGRPWTESVYRRISRPSRTAHRLLPTASNPTPTTQWRSDLSPDQVADVESIVDAFGLGSLYDAEGRPTGSLQ